ncbi:MAG: L,D-transpeptidase family protein, partial [Actinomycetota bacterium]
MSLDEMTRHAGRDAADTVGSVAAWPERIDGGRGSRPDAAADGDAVDERRRRLVLILAAAAVLALAGVAAVLTADDGPGTLQSDAAVAAVTDKQLDALTGGAGPETAQAAAALVDGQEAGASQFVEFVDTELAGVDDPDPEGSAGPERADGACTIGALSLRLGASGDGVRCLQAALAAAGHFDGAVDGEFGRSTYDAVQSYQVAENFFVDGVVGRETALGLDVWPDEESLVVRTPRPPAGATDLWGVELSPVASAGDDAPPLPENSGSGYRVVYDRGGQRVWAVDENERVIRSWLVSGSLYSNERPGTHSVYSKSEVSTAWNGKAYLPLMIRYQKTERGNIGFHGIPTKVDTGESYQTTDELGTRLS